jgi:hypothetical protein
MTDTNETRAWVSEPASAAPPPGEPAAQEAAVSAAAVAADRPEADRPEVPVAAAFAGGFLLAMLLRRLAR